MESSTTTKQLEVVFIPCPAPGHIVSTVEFANRLLSRHQQFQATILLIRSPWQNLSSPQKQELKPNDVNPDHNSNNSSRIRYMDLPEVDPPPKQLFHDGPEDFLSIYIASHRAVVRSAIDTSIAKHNSSQLAGIVIDLFSTSMIDVANDLNIPSYLFFTCSAAFLGPLLDLPKLNIQFNEEDNDDGSVSVSTIDWTTEFSISTFANPVPASALVAAFLTKPGHKAFSYHAKRFTETKGIILNTFSELEPYATKSLMSNYSDPPLPPLYTVGPVLDLKGEAHRHLNNVTAKQRIMTWLDYQPNSSVIFLCFGTGGSFTIPQVREIAIGLHQSGVRFLWSLRKPPTGDTVTKPGEYTEDEISKILPDGFSACLEEGRGMVCGWVPQVQVLAHRAIIGFVSHCGWNSTLESLWFGKPIVTWPLYAEQHCNALEMVRELGLAVELRLDYRREKGDLVKGDEIATTFKRVMEDKELRKRVEEVMVISKRVLMDGGSSFMAMESLVKDMEKNLFTKVFSSV